MKVLNFLHLLLHYIVDNFCATTPLSSTMQQLISFFQEYRGLLHKIVRFGTYIPTTRYVSVGVGMFPFLRNVPTSLKLTYGRYVSKRTILCNRPQHCSVSFFRSTQSNECSI